MEEKPLFYWNYDFFTFFFMYFSLNWLIRRERANVLSVATILLKLYLVLFLCSTKWNVLRPMWRVPFAGNKSDFFYFLWLKAFWACSTYAKLWGEVQYFSQLGNVCQISNQSSFTYSFTIDQMFSMLLFSFITIFCLWPQIRPSKTIIFHMKKVILK